MGEAEYEVVDPVVDFGIRRFRLPRKDLAGNTHSFLGVIVARFGQPTGHRPGDRIVPLVAHEKGTVIDLAKSLDVIAVVLELLGKRDDLGKVIAEMLVP